MNISNVKVNKKKDYFCIDFNLEDDFGLVTHNWVSVEEWKETYYFGDIVFRYDKDKKEVLDFIRGRNDELRTIYEPNLYLNEFLHSEVINAIFDSEEFQSNKFLKNKKFDLDNLYRKHKFNHRINNLKKLMKQAYLRNEVLDVIFYDCLFYTTLDYEGVGFIAINDLPDGDLFEVNLGDIEKRSFDYEKERMLKTLKLISTSKFALKMYSYIEDVIDTKGKKVRSEGTLMNNPWILFGEITFYDEIPFEDFFGLAFDLLVQDKELLEQFCEKYDLAELLKEEELVEITDIFLDKIFRTDYDIFEEKFEEVKDNKERWYEIVNKELDIIKRSFTNKRKRKRNKNDC